jgi:hypothetical protein
LEIPKERDHLEYQDIDGNMGIRMDLRETGCGYVNCIRLVQETGTGGELS